MAKATAVQDVLSTEILKMGQLPSCAVNSTCVPPIRLQEEQRQQSFYAKSFAVSVDKSSCRSSSSKNSGLRLPVTPNQSRRMLEETGASFTCAPMPYVFTCRSALALAAIITDGSLNGN
eukprot:scpid77617/ scgid27272/ 